MQGSVMEVKRSLVLSGPEVAHLTQTMCITIERLPFYTFEYLIASV